MKKGRPKIDLTGQKFGRWTVICEAGQKWLCQCECGVVKKIWGHFLKDGQSKSCGCLRKDLAVERETKHGKCFTPAYKSWTCMKQRCLNPNSPKFSIYGGRGIMICERWMVFENFLADMGERPEGTTLDRIDNDGHYESDNCRWATIDVQNNNKKIVNQYTKCL